jgi:uncharacterized protein YukE
MALEPAPTNTAGPIWTASWVWDLEATPATLEGAAEHLRALGTASDSAQATVDAAARQVAGEGSWDGETASGYQSHRASLTGDLGGLADQLTSLADGLDTIAARLRTGQALLDELLGGLADIESTTSESGVRFHPEDGAQADRVQQALTAADEVRTWVDDLLVERTPGLRTVQDAIGSISRTWGPHNVRLLNLNIGSGADTDSGNPPGADRDEIDQIAGLINREGADVVTLQEVFEEDLDEMEEYLERDGSRWTVHYAEASHKRRGYTPGAWSDSFGNAILVREGPVVASSEEIGEIKLDEEGDTAPAPEEFATDTGPDGEGRAADHVRIQFVPGSGAGFTTGGGDGAGGGGGGW